MRISLPALCLLYLTAANPGVLSAQPSSPACDSITKAHAAVAVRTPLGDAKGLLCLDDGDSFSIGPSWVRLKGIDAPRVGRNCIQWFGKDSIPKRCVLGLEMLAQLSDLLERGAECVAERRDARNRWLSTCNTADGRDISREMVSRGFACAASRYESTYVGTESTARAAQRGIWAEGTGYAPSKMCRLGRQ